MNIDDIIYDWIQADQIEVGDQIVIDGDPIEVDNISETEDDISEIIVYGFSHESGDRVTISLPYDYEIGLWAV